MSKIWKLFVNENIKTWKKLSTKILIIVILIALIGSLAIVKIAEKASESNQSTIDSIVGDGKIFLEGAIKNLEEELQNEQLDEQTRESYERQLQTYKLSLKYNVSPYKTSWKSEAIEKIIDSETEMATKIEKILEEDNFTQYIEIQKQEAKEEFDNGIIGEQEYKDQITILELKEKYEIGKNEDDAYWRTALLTQIKNAQTSLRTGIDTNNYNKKVLTVERQQELEESILMNIYRLEHNIPSIEYTQNFRTIYEYLAPTFVVAVIAITAMVMAGSAISTEISSGSIKFWALTPNKRWKILTAKILSILFYIIVITLVMSVLTVILGNIFFDTQAERYLFVRDGNVVELGNAVYLISLYFAKLIPVFIFALFALMLSVLTRNTAVAVSFSVAIYIGNTIAMAIINQFIKKDWIRFVPFNNLNIADKIFPNASNPISFATDSFATSTSLWFSLGVLGVCAILMLVTMYDSFNRRDII